MNIELIISVDVDKAGREPIEQAVRETVCKTLGKVKLSRRGWKMSFATVLPYHRQEPEQKPNYRTNAQGDAAETARNFLDEIIEKLVDGDPASDDLLNDYPNGDAWHHENHTDKDYDLLEAAEILKEFSGQEETDSGLWQGMEPERAICAQAAYTYANAVYGQFQRLIEQINDGYRDLIDDNTDREREAEEKRDRLEELEGQEKRDRTEYNELRQLRKAKISEDDVAEANKAAITAMVETTIKDFEP